MKNTECFPFPSLPAVYSAAAAGKGSASKCQNASFLGHPRAGPGNTFYSGASILRLHRSIFAWGATCEGRMEWIVGEFVHTLRSLRRNPMFAGIVLATLALGIGGTEATSARNRTFHLFYTGSLSSSKIGAVKRRVPKGLIFGKVERLRPTREGPTQPAWCNAISTGA
jgi:hypothetical protein